MRRPKVLIVEDEDTFALLLHRALYKANHRFDVLVAKTGEIGRQIMREMALDVLVTDFNLPGMSGLDLVYWAAIEAPETHFVVISGDEVGRIRDRACAVGCLQILVKPFEAAALLDAVLSALDSREKLSGQLSALSAVDLIQLLCLGRRSASVRITSSKTIGSLLIREGVLVHAIWGDKIGEDAVREIVRVSDGVFRTAPLPEGVERTIQREWGHVVMDAVRLLDEEARVPECSGTWPTLRVDSSEADEIFESVRGEALGADGRAQSGSFAIRDGVAPTRAAAALMDRGFAAVRAGNLGVARECWEAAQRLDPDNRSIELNLRKLDSLRRPQTG